MKKIGKVILSLAVMTMAALHASAKVHMCPLFTDNMVLQQRTEAPVWGTADPGSTVTVKTSWNKSVYTAEVGSDGRWMVKVSTPKAGGPYTMTIAESGSNPLIISNVLIGEVWLCSGQSNMEQPVSGSWCPVRNHEQEVKDANYPKIRLLGVKKTTATVPMDDFTTYGDGWQECSPESIPEFSATAYFFGRELFLEMGVPVGLIHSSWGGTVIEAWMTKDALAGVKDLGQMAEEVATWPADKPELKSNYPHAPTVLYNSMIEPLVPFAIKGAIWYQGCSNAERAHQYQDLMRLLIDDWRQLWGYDFPFYITQLANYTKRQTEPCESSWAELREAQAMAAQVVPDAGMAVTIDIGEADDIHPRNKQDVGKRLALQAMNKTYGKKVICDGPVYEGYEVDGNIIRVRFSSVAKGLVAKGDKLEGFTIAGADHQFHWADAKIVGDCIEVSCKDVPRPLAVRYAWAHNPLGNLYNTAGLPAGPFRTDSWKGVTYGKTK